MPVVYIKDSRLGREVASKIFLFVRTAIFNSAPQRSIVLGNFSLARSCWRCLLPPKRKYQHHYHHHHRRSCQVLRVIRRSNSSRNRQRRVRVLSANISFAQPDSAAQAQVFGEVLESSSQKNSNSNTSSSATTATGSAGTSLNSSLKDGLGLPTLDVESAAATAETSTSSLTPYPSIITPRCRTPSDAGLRLETGSSALNPYPSKTPLSMTSSTAMEASSSSADSTQYMSQGASGVTSHYNPVLKSAMSAASFASSMSPRSALSSPSLHALTDLTPLPSPLLTGESPGPWRRSTVRPDV